MKLGPAPKVWTEDGHRTVDPATTYKRIEPLCKTAGITRVADITGLDRVGIPVFSSIRPDAKSGAITVYNGKGASVIQAKVSAIMEALERYSGEWREDTLVRRTVDDMLASENTLDPRSLILPQRTAIHVMSQPVAWVKGLDLIENEEIWVPASAAFHPYYSPKDIALFRTNTNGLASGNAMEEAVVHGLCELVERDAWSICESKRSVIGDVLPSEEDGLIHRMLEKFSSNGIEIRLKDLTSDIGLPTFAAAADDVRLQDPALLSLGMGTHLNPKITVIRALTEVAQSRLTQIHGAREDTVRGKTARQMGYERVKRMNQMWFADSKKSTDLAEYRCLDTADLYDDLQVILACLTKRGFKRVVAVDLTREELDIPVVKMIVPGLEVFAMDEERAGMRLRRGTS
jgi:ribosomal protein S12 methylthiotransferase accessory factor